MTGNSKMISHFRQRSRSLLEYLFYPPHHTALGRWCHKQADAYRATCSWDRKVHQANEDCGPMTATSFDSDDKQEEYFRILCLLGEFHSLKKTRASEKRARLF